LETVAGPPPPGFVLKAGLGNVSEGAGKLVLFFFRGSRQLHCAQRDVFFFLA